MVAVNVAPENHREPILDPRCDEKGPLQPRRLVLEGVLPSPAVNTRGSLHRATIKKTTATPSAVGYPCEIREEKIARRVMGPNHLGNAMGIFIGDTESTILKPTRTWSVPAWLRTARITVSSLGSHS